MQAAVGDKLLVYSKQVGTSAQHGEIIEVHGDNGAPPYLVRFEDGHQGLVFPGPDCVIEHVASARKS